MYGTTMKMMMSNWHNVKRSITTSQTLSIPSSLLAIPQMTSTMMAMVLPHGNSTVFCNNNKMITRTQTTTSSSSSSTATATNEQQSNNNNNDPNKFRRIYVHKISQTILQHLQDNRYEWLQKNGLDRGLRLNSNGTFVLQYPTFKKGYDSGRIWTSYDAGTKQHWLSVYRQKLKVRFLLREVKYVDPPVVRYPKFTTFKAAAAEAEKADDQLRHIVDQMIETLEEGNE